MMQHGMIGFNEGKNVSGNEEQKKLQRTGNSDWLDAEREIKCFRNKGQPRVNTFL